MFMDIINIYVLEKLHNATLLVCRAMMRKGAAASNFEGCASEQKKAEIVWR
jgi:hypothetical protein